MKDNLNLDSYDFYLPKELIAQLPPPKRTDSKLLVYFRQEDKVQHLKFSDIVNLLDEDWCIILNNTKVENRKIECKKPTGGVVPILITSYENNKIKFLPYKKIKINQKLILPNGKEGLVVDKNLETSEFELLGDFKISEIEEIIKEYGLAPLPPYIKRKPKDPLYNIDSERYQTVFAKVPASLAAPTAGFHFDNMLLETLEKKGVKILYLTLNIGLSTFKPIKTKDVSQHKMQPEELIIDEDTAKKINTYFENNKKILCVGTTVVRSVEFLYSKFGKIKEYKGLVDIYIYPGYKFKFVKSMITNFHLPKSTNLLLVAALIGKEKLFELYKIAIEKKYKFYSYGDAMLII
ncbi:MAG: tRNA preQ1(34) S-adenosylmethionine ribosyltransferase-isomerase QueA [Elusimicrobiota bacterium]|nr:tRNA preQ1(34) S-adenosylmethionine ribosyltransferase-isomerase QueA [Endomicrobiia bacterium]MCX7910899.1 tRNA preQ1(34) S-adenosylmethionine ribosyltransferase-isomerase QueA [Endomicrobiia bacterium]MDW8165422.1 tRNA preQ1(34) S-adenosylmethionine ribosyltransferase-isomerase QueA [Elusimicrobiota bacterium]